MSEMIGYLLLAGVFFSGCGILVAIAVFKKPRRKLGAYAAICLLVAVCATARTTYLFARKSYHRLTKVVRPRTGSEIYTALFGPPTACAKVINRQDQVVPRIDYAIWLEFETCPAELRRILALHEFVAAKQAARHLSVSGPSAGDNWFKPETLGDTVLVFQYRKDDYGNGQTIYAKLDSTRAYCVDALD